MVFIAVAMLLAGRAGAASIPVFTLQPQSQTVAVNSTVTFNSQATGSPTPTYQWRKDGANIPSAIGATLTVSLVQTSDAGTYSVVATNSEGSATSAGAVLAIYTAPSITTQPQSQTVTAGTSVYLSVVATGTPAPTYQWRKGGVDIAAPAGTASTLTFANVKVSDAGSYTVVVTNSIGNVTSNAAVLTVNDVVPVITAQPAGHTIAVGSTVVFEVQATGNIVSAQWKKDGVALTGGTSTRFVLANAQLADAGGYSVALTNTAGSVTSTAATLSVINTANPGRIFNLSIRGTSGTGDKVLIMGFVTGGDGVTGNTSLLIRGVGPSIIPAPYNVADALTDPLIQIIPAGSSTAIASNDDWGGTTALKNAASATGAFSLISDTSKDAALIADLPHNLYSVVVSGNGGASGSVLAEMYDMSPSYNATTPRLVNISARAYVSATDTLIAGFVIVGQTAKTVLIRAVGPDPAFAAAVNHANLSDPGLLLYYSHDGTTALILSADNWGGDAQITSVGNRVGASALSDPNSKDAAVLVTLEPGVYSAQISTQSGSAGIALGEVYDVP